MPKLSDKSMMELNTIHPDLRALLLESIKYIDFIITEGHRSKERQEELLKAGKSKTMNSRHLSYPSEAVDIAPYPYPNLESKNQIEREKALMQVYYMIGVIRGIAIEKNIKIRVGADFNRNNDIRDENFLDAWHIELDNREG